MPEMEFKFRWLLDNLGCYTGSQVSAFSVFEASFCVQVLKSANSTKVTLHHKHVSGKGYTKSKNKQATEDLNLTVVGRLLSPGNSRDGDRSSEQSDYVPFNLGYSTWWMDFETVFSDNSATVELILKRCNAEDQFSRGRATPTGDSLERETLTAAIGDSHGRATSSSYPLGRATSTLVKTCTNERNGSLQRAAQSNFSKFDGAHGKTTALDDSQSQGTSTLVKTTTALQPAAPAPTNVSDVGVQVPEGSIDTTTASVAVQTDDELQIELEAALAHIYASEFDQLSHHTDENFTSTDDAIRVLECQVCQALMEPPISMCATGHSFCSKCKTKVKKCPMCSKVFLDGVRNFTLESLTDYIFYPCGADGCPTKHSLADRETHRKECLQRTVTCSLPCEWKGKLFAYRAHMEEKHTKPTAGNVQKIDYMNENVFASYAFEMSDFPQRERHQILICDGVLFELRLKMSDGEMFACIQHIGSATTANKYKFTVKLQSVHDEIDVNSEINANVHCDLDHPERECVPLGSGKMLRKQGLVTRDGEISLQVRIFKKIKHFEQSTWFAIW